MRPSSEDGLASGEFWSRDGGKRETAIAFASIKRKIDCLSNKLISWWRLARGCIELTAGDERYMYIDGGTV